jgi:hypothetical protein
VKRKHTAKDAETIAALERDLAEPITSIIERAERRAAGTHEHVEFNVTVHDDAGAEVFRRDACRFTAVDGRIVLGEALTFKVPDRTDKVIMAIRDTNSDVVLLWAYPNLYGGFGDGLYRDDSVDFPAGSVSWKSPGHARGVGMKHKTRIVQKGIDPVLASFAAVCSCGWQQGSFSPSRREWAYTAAAIHRRDNWVPG